jgi:acyl-CoA hydrolase
VEDERFAFLPQSWINDPRVIARNQRMVSVNSALAVSLEGDVCASSIGTMKYSGVGGARDFALGADMSDGGWPVIALPSTYLSGGELKSRICAVLPRGAHVTSSGDTVQNVVTEFGSASLKGRTIRQRAAAMIRLAHPDFQDGLLEEARALHGLQALSLAEGECAFVPAA